MVESTSGGEDGPEIEEAPPLPVGLQELTLRLLPLRHIEQLLIAKLVPPGEDEATHFGNLNNNGHDRAYRNQEIFVRPGTSWKGFVARGKGNLLGGRPLSAGTTGIETQDEPTAVIHECRRDMMSLWRDQTVRKILRKRRIRLEEQPGL